MKTLIVEDEFTSRVILQKLLQSFGDVHMAKDGTEAIEAFRLCLAEKAPYDLVCLDIVMPGIPGDEVLKQIRSIEDEAGIYLPDGVKILMTSAIDDGKRIFGAFFNQCDGYLIKPIAKKQLLIELKKIKLIADDEPEGYNTAY